MQGAKTNAKTLGYYPTVEEIFQELSRQAGTKVPIPAKAKETDLSIEESLTDQEKEEDYELNLYISTFVSEEASIEGTGRIQNHNQASDGTKGRNTCRTAGNQSS